MNTSSVSEKTGAASVCGIPIDQLKNDDLPEILEAIYCRQALNRLSERASCCEVPVLIAESPPSNKSTHFKKATCAACGKFHAWIPKPKNLAARASSSRALPPGDFCVICMDQGALEVHHIVPVADGGTNAPDNRMTVCAPCHALIHWRRRDRGLPR